LSQRRTGSTFAIKTIKSALGVTPKRHSRSITPYGRCSDLLDKNSFQLWWDMWRSKTKIIKVEEPYSHHELVNHLMTSFPKVKVVSTLRKVEDIVNSRMSLREAWGKSTSVEKILEEWISHYEYMKKFSEIHPKKLFIIDIDRPQNFIAEDFCHFLGIKSTQDFQDYAKSFMPVNSLEAQAKRHKLEADKVKVSTISRQELIELCPRLEEYERGYKALLKSTL